MVVLRLTEAEKVYNTLMHTHTHTHSNLVNRDILIGKRCVVYFMDSLRMVDQTFPCKRKNIEPRIEHFEQSIFLTGIVRLRLYKRIYSILIRKIEWKVRNY